ncbi:MAG: DUF5989 family protein [Pirellulales bacterium]
MPGDEVEKVQQNQQVNVSVNVQTPATAGDDFEKASQEQQVGLAREFLEFLADNKKWWLLPIVLVLLVFGVLVLFSGTAAAPFIYTLF